MPAATAMLLILLSAPLAKAAWGGNPHTPQFPPAWDLRASTWVMACNYTDFMRPELTAKWGVVSPHLMLRPTQ